MSQKSNFDRASILRSAWTAARVAAAAAGEGVRAHIGAAMKAAWSAAKAAAAPVQDCTAAHAEILTARAERDRRKVEMDEALALLRECRKERVAAVAGEIDACPGICWTNEERAEARYEEACDAHDRAEADYWETLNYLPDPTRAMIPQVAQLQQANAGAVLPEPEVAPAEPARHTVEISAVANDFNSRMRGGTYYQILFLPDGAGGFLPGVRADQADGAVILSRASYVDKYASYARAYDRNSETRVRITLPVGALRKSTRGWVKRLNADGAWEEIELAGNMRKGDGWATIVSLDGAEVELT